MIKKLVKTLLEEIGILGRKSAKNGRRLDELCLESELVIRDIEKIMEALEPEVKMFDRNIGSVIVRRKTRDLDVIKGVQSQTLVYRQELREAIKEQEGLIKGLNQHIRDLRKIRNQALSEGDTEAVTMAQAEIDKVTGCVSDFKQKLSENKLTLRNLEYDMGIVRRRLHSLVFPFAMAGGEKGEVTSADLTWAALDMLDVAAGPADMIVGCLIDPVDGVKRSDIFSCLTTKANKLGDEIVKNRQCKMLGAMQKIL
ncbi:MAG: hypothetical protein R3F23_05715 [Verrucomicrobiia bacterium]